MIEKSANTKRVHLLNEEKFYRAKSKRFEAKANCIRKQINELKSGL